MTNKVTLRKKHVALIALGAVVLLFCIKMTNSTQATMNLIPEENVHTWRAQGECAECHSEHEYVDKTVDFKHTLPIPAAKTHTEQFRRFTHGKDERFSQHSCRSCHEAQSCTNCHATLPESHTGDFIEPTGHSAGSLRHAILAKSSPTACYTCHQSFTESCTECHSVEELRPWQLEAEKAIVRWAEILELQ